MSGFLSPLRVELADEDAGLWRLTQALHYQSDHLNGHRVVVPEGFCTDFASVPRLPIIYLATADTAHAPAVVHDWLYTSGDLPRRIADKIFLEAMEAVGVPWLRRQAMYAAVRLMGGRRYRSTPPDPPLDSLR